MKNALLFLILLFVLSNISLASDCADKVKTYHQQQFEETYLKSQDLFFDMFINRENLLHHIFAYPEAAFGNLANINDNFIAYKMVRRAKKNGLTEADLLSVYEESLSSGELCKRLGEKYINPRKIRSFIYNKLDI